MLQVPRAQGADQTLRQALAIPGPAHVDAGRDFQRTDSDDALGSGVRRQGQDPGVLPQDRQDGSASAIHALIQNNGVLVTASSTMDDDIASAQRGHGACGLLAARGATGPGEIGLGIGDALTQARVLAEVSEVTGHLLLHGGEAPAHPAGLGGELDDTAVGLVLGEGGLEHFASPGPRGAPEQVDRHVVRGPEGRDERVGAPRRQRGDEGGVDPAGGQDDGMPLRVDAASAGSSGQLGVLARAQGRVGRPVPLAQGLQDHGAGGHIDAEGQSLGGVDDLDQARAEELLNGFLEDGKKAGVMGGHALLQGMRPAVESQHAQICCGDLAHVPVDDLTDSGRLGISGQADPGAHGLVDGLLAAGAREHEDDRWEKVGLLERRDDRDP